MKEIIADGALIAACGLYCGACPAYTRESCPGCAKNEKASWCPVRNCCIEKKIKSCAVCADHADARACGKFNNFFSKMIGFFLRSSRPKCIDRIKAIGDEAYAKEMAAEKRQTIRP